MTPLGHRVMNLVSFCLNQIGAWHVVDEEGRQQEQFDLQRSGKNPPLLFFVCENSCLVVLKRVCIHYICRTAIHWCIAVRMAISNPEAVDWALSLALTYPDTLPRARSTPNDLMILRLSLSLALALLHFNSETQQNPRKPCTWGPFWWTSKKKS